MDEVLLLIFNVTMFSSIGQNNKKCVLVLMQAKRSKHPLGPNFQHQHNFVQMQPMTRMPMPMMAPSIPGA
jgi:hypothetical protein